MSLFFVMAFVCRVRVNPLEYESDEIVSNVIAMEVVDDREWHLVNFTAAERRLGVRALRWVRDEMKGEYDVILTVRGKAVAKGLRELVGEIVEQRCFYKYYLAI